MRLQKFGCLYVVEASGLQLHLYVCLRAVLAIGVLLGDGADPAHILVVQLVVLGLYAFHPLGVFALHLLRRFASFLRGVEFEPQGHLSFVGLAEECGKFLVTLDQIAYVLLVRDLRFDKKVEHRLANFVATHSFGY